MLLSALGRAPPCRGGSFGKQPGLCGREQTLFCEEKAASHLWSSMRGAVVLQRSRSASLCLLVVGAPVVVVPRLSFSPPPRGREDPGGGVVTSWCSYAICLRPGIKTRCSWGAGSSLRPGAPNEIADLLLPLLLQLLGFTEICCGNGLPNGLQAARRERCVSRRVL